MRQITPTSDNDHAAIKDEITLMKLADCPNILHCFEAYRHRGNYFMIVEMTQCTLHDLLKERAGHIPEKLMAYICAEVLKCLNFLALNGIIHKEVRSENLLLTNAGEVKMGDACYAAPVDSECALRRIPNKESVCWASPEQVMGNRVDCKVNIWSLGIMAIELAEGQPPYYSEERNTAMMYIASRPAPKLKNRRRWSEEFSWFVSDCLKKNPKDRPTAAKLTQHPFITELLEENCKAEFATYVQDWLANLRD